MKLQLMMLIIKFRTNKCLFLSRSDLNDLDTNMI